MDKQPDTSEDADDLGGSVTVAPSVTYQLQTAVQTQVQGTVQILFFSLSETLMCMWAGVIQVVSPGEFTVTVP